MEISAKELRIGNFVNSPYDRGVIKVNAADIFLMANGHYREARFEPIELTEEWLLKFGFDVEDNGLSTYYGSQHDFTIDTDNNKTWKIFGYNGGFKHLYFVHELQNLYFDLTGSELTIKK